MVQKLSGIIFIEDICSFTFTVLFNVKTDLRTFDGCMTLFYHVCNMIILFFVHFGCFISKHAICECMKS